MPTATYQFTTFASSGTGVAWINPGNAQTANGIFATASLSAANPTTQLLVCTGASISLPDKAVITKIEVNIKGQRGTGSLGDVQVHEIWPWDGSGLTGQVPATSRNQAGTYTFSAGTTPIALDGTNTVSTRGTNNWKWWWLSRLTNSVNGVAIRAQRVTGSPAVWIDVVELVVSYVVVFHTRVDPVDYRTIAYECMAGISGDVVTKNENDEAYQPTTRGTGHVWHDEPQDWLDWYIPTRTAKGIKRLVFGGPSGSISMQDFSSHQWEPMFDDQRAALMSTIPAWLAGDPAREAIMYMGTQIKDPAFLDMISAHDPDVSDPDDVAILERTFFPIRDCLGIRRFLLDASNPINRTKALALFAWGRANGMEFVMEAIPYLGDPNSGPDLDKNVTEVYSAYALSGYIIGDDTPRTGNDTGLLWAFPKGRLLVRINSADYDSGFATETEKRRFFQRFAEEGYILMPRDPNGELDEAAQIVTGEWIGRGISFPVAGSVSRGISNSTTRFFDQD